MDIRLQSLMAWLRDTAHIDKFEIAPASADASFRRYFRVSYDGKTVIAMDAPPEKEDSPRYVKRAQLLQRIGLHVPEIIQTDFEHGFLLISDLGSTQYLQALGETNVEALYGDALAAIFTLQSTTDDGVRELPAYDDAILTRELGIFDEWFLGKHLNIAMTAELRGLLDEMHALLKRSALEQPRVGVHRDFHSRNLMVTPERNPGVLDFQDALYGPVTYDLASLLRDCYISWPRAQVEAWVELHRSKLAAHGLPVTNREQFLRWFDLMGMQRHLKAIGIFARLNHRDGKPGYLKDIPRTLGYVLDVSTRTPELARFRDWLRSDVISRM